MTTSTGQRRHHFKNTLPRDPAITPFAEWPTPNRSFHHAFYQWLKSGGYGPSALNTYSVAARLALGFLNQSYWTIDPDVDIEKVHDYIANRYASSSTRLEYFKGLRKLAEYLGQRRDKTAPPRPVNWGHYLDGLPDWLCDHVREFVAYKQKGCRPEEQHRRNIETLSDICTTLRWMAGHVDLAGIRDITPQLWLDFLDTQIKEGKHPNTVNGRLFRLKAFLYFLDEAGEPICARMLLVPVLKSGPRLPRDVPISQLHHLLEEISKEVTARHASRRRMGIMDQAWFHLMLHSGLRTCEIRRLRLANIDWENRRIRIEQSKGLKDRLVYVNTATVDALRAWLDLRGEAEYLSYHVFLYRHQPLSRRYCHVRLRTYGKRCGVRITPHQLRHSCATMLLNAGAPVVSVQALLGHEKVDTTLNYARLYDGTIAADYYRAISKVEQLFIMSGGEHTATSGHFQWIAMLDSLDDGTLKEHQHRMVQALRDGILSYAMRVSIQA
jgi:site-specific recombinase XerD